MANPSKLNKIFPKIERIKLKQFLQRRSLVIPLSELPNNPSISKDKRDRIRENIKTVVILVIVPIKKSNVKISDMIILIEILVKL